MTETGQDPAPKAGRGDARAELIALVRAVAAKKGADRLGLVTFLRTAGIGASRVYKHFESWPALCEAAGLRPNPRNERVAEGDILAAMHATFLRHGGLCTLREFLPHAPCSHQVLKRRFASWLGALAAFRRWVGENAPDFPYLAELDARLDPLPAAPLGGTAAGPGRSWPCFGTRPSDTRLSGAPVGFRALLFAPVNEQGVVLLFGMVADDLGYGVETVTTGFPDCTARRRVAGDLWESVRVEFEFRSRSFRDHGHDPDGCDVIVCWEHDWPDCPLEVLALRPAIAALAG